LEKLFASPVSAQMGYVDGNALLQGLDRAKNGDAPQLIMLLKAVYLELWLRSLEEHGIVKLCSERGPASQPARQAENVGVAEASL
jgi:hypothetical protein